MDGRRENKNTALGFNIASLVCNIVGVVFGVLVIIAGIVTVVVFSTVFNDLD